MTGLWNLAISSGQVCHPTKVCELLCARSYVWDKFNTNVKTSRSK